jgi:uncharacterized protein YdbL (DUF1318 family)
MNIAGGRHMLLSNVRNSIFAPALSAWMTLATAGAVLVSPVIVIVPAMAQSAAAKAAVDAGKAQGVIGEQGDGFLGFVMPPGDPALAAAVAEINAGRAQAFREAAVRTGVTPDAAGQATAQQLFMRLPAGQYFKPINGNWTRK